MDPGLREAVLERIDKGKQDFAGLEELHLDPYTQSGTVESLAGLECAGKLKSLRLERQRIEALEPLRGLTELKTLALEHNPVSSSKLVETLGHQLPRLEELSISLGERDSEHSWLGRLSSIRAIRLSGAGLNERAFGILLEHEKIESLALAEVGSFDEKILGQYCGPDATVAASRCSELKKLVLFSASISDLKWLPESSRLRWLDLRSNSLVNLKFLPRAKKLTHLFLDRNPLRSFRRLKELRELEHLKLSNCRNFWDLSIVAGLPKLWNLRASRCAISDLSPLKNNTLLRDLRVSKNEIVSVEPLSHIDSLVILDIGANKIKKIDPLKTLSHLEKLFMPSNLGITSTAALTGLRKLAYLDARGCRLKDVVGLAKLVREGALRTILLTDNSKELCDHPTMKELLALKKEPAFATSLVLTSDCD